MSPDRPPASAYEATAADLYEAVMNAAKSAMEVEPWGIELMWEDFQREVPASLGATIREYKPHTVGVIDSPVRKLTGTERRLLWVWLRLEGDELGELTYDMVDRLTSQLADDILEVLWMESGPSSWR